jgi:hypothetical protein
MITIVTEEFARERDQRYGTETPLQLCYGTFCNKKDDCQLHKNVELNQINKSAFIRELDSNQCKLGNLLTKFTQKTGEN